MATICIQHKPEILPTIDQDGIEVLCTCCGQVIPTEEIGNTTTLQKFWLTLEDYYNSRYGPSMPAGLQKFLLAAPRDKRLKCRDKFLYDKDQKMLAVYTGLLRICEQYAIPKFYANEAMRLMIKRNKGLHSANWQVKTLIESISKEALLRNRIPALQMLIKPRKNTKKERQGILLYQVQQRRA